MMKKDEREFDQHQMAENRKEQDEIAERVKQHKEKAKKEMMDSMQKQ